MKKPEIGHPNVTNADSFRQAVIELLRQAELTPGAAPNADLLYELERYGRSLAESNEHKVAARHFKRTVATLKKYAGAHMDHTQELHINISSGQTYALLGQQEDAQLSYEQAIQLSQNLHENRLQARALRALGNLYLQQGRTKEAIARFNESIDLCRDAGEALDEAYALNSLAAAHFQNAAWPKMQKACDQALAIAENLQEDELVACVYNNLGAMHSLRGQWDQALAAFQKCLPIFEQLGDQRGLAETYNNMGTVFRDKDLWHEAGKCYARSLHFAAMTGDAMAKAAATLNRVELYILMHDLELARHHCRDVLNTYHQLHFAPGEADACKLMGVIYTHEKQWQLAKKYFDEALATSKAIDYKLGLAETHARLAEYYQARHEHEQAVEQMRQAAKQFRALKAARKARMADKRAAEWQKQAQG